MTDDIAALIEQLKKADTEGFAWLLGLEFTHDDEAQDAKDTIINALSRLTTPPLPAEIAGLIERWEKRIAWTAKWKIDDRLDNDTIAALRALAQEAQRWKTIATDWHRDCDNKSECIRELEVERDWLAKRSDDLQTEVNAIRRKTIEECLAKLPEDTPAYVCAALRALAHSEGEGKEES